MFKHLTQNDKVLIPLFQKEILESNKTSSKLLYQLKVTSMKTPDKNKVDEAKSAAKPKLKTEKPLAEKDEVKAAEEKLRKKAK